jgi:hypothetical protein
MKHGVSMGRLTICIGLPKPVDLGRYQDDDIPGAGLNKQSIKSRSLNRTMLLHLSG